MGAPRAADYAAFISYSRGPDSQVVEAVERGLQRLAKPWRARRTVDVFRDTSKLAGGDDLSGQLGEAMDGSRCFVLMASPGAAQSPWVDKEVRYWAATRGTSDLIVVLCGGQLIWDDRAARIDDSVIDCAAPPGLVDHLTTEPAYIDLSWASQATAEERLSLDDPQFRTAIAQIQAAIRGLPVDDVYAEDLREYRAANRRRRVVIATLCAFVVGLAVLAVVANSARNEAEQRLVEATARLAAIRAQSVLETNPVEAGALALDAYRAEPSADHLMLLGSVVRSGLREELDLSDLAVSAAGVDGTRVVLGFADGAVGLVTPDQGLTIGSGDDDEPVAAVAIDGLIAVSGTSSGKLDAWDIGEDVVDRGPSLQLDDRIEAIEILAGARLAVVGTFGGDVVLVDIEGWQVVRVLPSRHLGSLLGLAVSQDGSRLVATSRDRVQSWSTDTWQLTAAAIPPPVDIDNPFWSAATPIADDALMAFTDTGGVHVFDGDGQLVSDLESFEEGLSVAVGVQRPERHVAVTDGVVGFTTANQAITFITPDGDIGRAPVPMDDGTPLRLEITSPDQIVVSVTERSVRWWGWDDGGAVNQWRVANRPARVVAADRGGRWAAGAEDGTLVLFDQHGAELGRSQLDGPVRGLDFSPNGRLLASDESGGVWHWIEGSAAPKKFAAVDDGLRGAVWSSDGSELSLAGASGVVHRFTAEGLQLQPIQAHDEFVRALAYSADSDRLLSSSSDGTLRIWDLSSGQKVAEFRAPGSPLVLSFAPNHGMTRIAIGTDDGTVWVWEPDSDDVQPIGNHQGWVRAVAWSQDESLLVSAGVDEDIRFYNGATLKPFGSAVATGSGVESLVVSSTDGRLLSAHLDGYIREWTIDSDGWIEHVCALVAGPGNSAPASCIG